MADTQKVRRTNLRRLVSEHEGMSKLASRLGLKKSAYISQLLADPPVRQISEKSARAWEQKLALPQGWMDGQPKGRSTATPVVSAPAIDVDLLERVMTVAFEELKKAGVMLAPTRLSGLMAMQYSDAVLAGRVDIIRIRKIVGLLKR